MLRFLRWKPVSRKRLGISRRLRIKKDEKAIESYIRQERFARRYGLKVLTALITVFMYSVLVTAAYWITLYLYTHGDLQVPEESNGSGSNALQSPK